MRNNLKRLLLLSGSLITVPSMAGSSSGTGPPSKQQLAEMLMSQSLGGHAGLFLNEAGEINLGLNRALDSDLVLSKSESKGQALTISELDFDSLSVANNRSIDAVTVGDLEPQTRSYLVEDGEKLGELVLKDRRQVARNSVK